LTRSAPAITRRAGFDLAVVGAGIVGLACALAAVRKGKRVVVIERDAQANGASVRNFGFVTITGQAPGAMWLRAGRSRQVWEDVAGEADVAILQRGLMLAVRRPESMDVLEAFMATDMAATCALLDGAEARSRMPALAGSGLLGALWSPHELRVDSRQAIPRLARWLETRHGVEFRWRCSVHAVETSKVVTSGGTVEAEAVAVCPGDDLTTLFPEITARHRVTRCKLQMMRLASPGVRLPCAVMSDLGLVRYAGYASLPRAKALRRRLEDEQGAQLANGVHLIVVQDEGGELVVGDSHHYADTPDAFASALVDDLILDEFSAVFGGAAPSVQERWLGTYAHASAGPVLVETPLPGVRLAMVTTGAGASTGFALGEEVVDGLFGGAGRHGG
jgi:FAD dependent oxidoreductase TIGR03364